MGLKAAKGANMRCIITYTDSTATEDFYAYVLCTSYLPVLTLRPLIFDFFVFGFDFLIYSTVLSVLIIYSVFIRFILIYCTSLYFTSFPLLIFSHIISLFIMSSTLTSPSLTFFIFLS